MWPGGSLRRVGCALAAAAALAGCGGGGSRPAVIPMLSSLPDDPERRAAVLDSARAQPGPEHQRAPLRSRKLQQAETTAATVAAMLGTLFSSSANAMIGTASAFEENALVAPQTWQLVPAGRDQDEGEEGAPVEEAPAQLPWLRPLTVDAPPDGGPEAGGEGAAPTGP